jgi:maleylpyruvate isomerase
MLTLFTYFRSSASYRVRIALILKGLTPEMVPIHLVRDGGEQHSVQFAKRNPACLVPVLQHGTLTVAQSLAIIEYLEEIHPTPPLLPREIDMRAKVRAMALAIACDIHPLNNLRVLNYLKTSLGIDEEARTEWARHWITLGFDAIERTLVEQGSKSGYCYGDSPTLADCCLIPQVFNAKRAGVSVERFPTIAHIYEHCTNMEAFRRASPAAQLDAE